MKRNGTKDRAGHALFHPGPIVAPKGTDSAFIRLRIKVTEPIQDEPSTSPRTNLETTAIDFQI